MQTNPSPPILTKDELTATRLLARLRCSLMEDEMSDGTQRTAPRCVFCEPDKPGHKIIGGWWAIENAAPRAPANYLFMPIQHYTSLLDVDEESWCMVMAAVTQFISENFEKFQHGYRLVVNCGRAARQSQPHLHVQLFGGGKRGKDLGRFVKAPGFKSRKSCMHPQEFVRTNRWRAFNCGERRAPVHVLFTPPALPTNVSTEQAGITGIDWILLLRAVRNYIHSCPEQFDKGYRFVVNVGEDARQEWHLPADIYLLSGGVEGLDLECYCAAKGYPNQAKMKRLNASLANEGRPVPVYGRDQNQS